MQQLAQGIYTKQQIIDVLHARRSPRIIKFRYDLLNKDEIKIGELNTVESCEIQMAKDADIKRTAKFTIKDEGNINWLSDRIQPFFMLQMPAVTTQSIETLTWNDYTDVAWGDILATTSTFEDMTSTTVTTVVQPAQWVEWSLGIFLLSSPQKEDKFKNVFRNVEAYDATLILQQDKLDYRAFFPAGSKYIDNIKSLLSGAGITKINIEDCADTLQSDLTWDVGTSRLKIVNDLLKDIIFTQIWVDEYGYFTSKRNISPSVRATQYQYIDNNLSLITPGVTEELDLFNVPNQWTVIVSNADINLSATYTNTNPDSPTSTINRGRTISADPEILNYISSQDALNQYVALKAFKESQVYGKITFNTAIMPMHSYNDVLQLDYSPLNISGKYEEIGWTLPLKANSKMQHILQKVVSV